VLYKSVQFQTPELTKFLMYSEDLSMDRHYWGHHTYHDARYCKHFIGYAIRNSNDTRIQLIQFCIFHYKQFSLRTSRRNGPENEIPIFLSNDQENSCPERHEHEGRSGMVHHVTGKCSSREMMQTEVSVIARR